jgi:hypothetical protein
MKRYVIFAFLVFGFSLHSQVVNIEEKRITTDSTGWAGSASAEFSLVKIDNLIANLNTDAHVQNTSRKNQWLFISSFNFLQAENTNLVNEGFVHFRFNRELTKGIRWEAFTQGQFNGLTKISFRGLTGTGPRFTLTESKNFKSYLGTLYMFEYEEIDDEGTIHRDHRMSSYLSFSIKPSATFSFVSTTYFQPRLDQFGDFRLSTDNAILLKISDKLQFKTTYSLLHDTSPPSEVPGTTYRWMNGLKFSF